MEEIIESNPPPVETITFDPPISVSDEILGGSPVVSSADIIPQDDPSQVVAQIYEDGRVIGVPFITDNETSIRTFLTTIPSA